MKEHIIIEISLKENEIKVSSRVEEGAKTLRPECLIAALASIIQDSVEYVGSTRKDHDEDEERMMNIVSQGDC